MRPYQVLSTDLTGHVFGLLTVLSQAESDSKGNTRWVCRCTCGQLVIKFRGALLHGSFSCERTGCKRRAAIHRARLWSDKKAASVPTVNGVVPEPHTLAEIYAGADNGFMD